MFSCMCTPHFSLFKIYCVCVYVCMFACDHACMYPQSSEKGIRSPGARVTGPRELLDWMLGTELRPSARAMNAFTHCLLRSPFPPFPVCSSVNGHLMCRCLEQDVESFGCVHAGQLATSHATVVTPQFYSCSSGPGPAAPTPTSSMPRPTSASILSVDPLMTAILTAVR